MPARCARVLAVQGLSTNIIDSSRCADPATGRVRERPAVLGLLRRHQGALPGRRQDAAAQFQGQTLPYAVCGYTPRQFRGAYEQDAARYTGAGQSVGIVDAYAAPTDRAGREPVRLAPRRQSRSARASSRRRRAGRRDAEECDASGWFGEETLDVAAVHGMAPGSRVQYYGAAELREHRDRRRARPVVETTKPI